MWNVGPSLVDDAGGVLAAVLQEQQPVVEQLVHRRGGDGAYDSAHCSFTPCDPFMAVDRLPAGAGIGAE